MIFEEGGLGGPTLRIDLVKQWKFVKFLRTIQVSDQALVQCKDQICLQRVCVLVHCLRWCSLIVAAEYCSKLSHKVINRVLMFFFHFQFRLLVFIKSMTSIYFSVAPKHSACDNVRQQLNQLIPIAWINWMEIIVPKFISQITTHQSYTMIALANSNYQNQMFRAKFLCTEIRARSFDFHSMILKWDIWRLACLKWSSERCLEPLEWRAYWAKFKIATLNNRNIYHYFNQISICLAHFV